MARTVRLELTANVKGLVAGLNTGARAVSGFAKDVDSFQKKNRQALDDIGGAAGKAGLAAAAGLGLVAKAAMDWESAFTGVRKTTDATEAQYAQLEQGLRGLAKTLPATHEEIAGVAEAAGQLGVVREDIVGFTKTMVDLGETTNLTAEDAATNIAQISNVMGTMDREGSKGVERFGAALVALGNDGASTESEILSMAQRIAGAGKTLGASESDVLALSNTLASMGVNAELGGGVATRVLLKMRSAVDEGGESLKAFSEVAGVSADEFATKFREAPMEALDLVAQGIARVNDQGGNVTATLKDMGIKGTEETQVMLSLAAAGDLLADSLALGNKAWDENTALLAEAEQRYGTTEAKISIAWNKIKDAAIDAGAAILPIIANVADAVGGLADWFNELPAPMQGFVTTLGGIGAAAGLGVAGLTAILGQLSKLHEAFGNIYVSGGKAQKAIQGIGKTATVIAVAVTVLAAAKVGIEKINAAVRAGKPDIEAYFNLLATGGGKSLSDGLKFDPGNDFSGLKQLEKLRTEADVAKNAINQLQSMNDALLGRWWAEQITMGDTRKHVDEALELEKALKAVAQAFDMGEADRGIEALSSFADQMKLTDEQVAQMINNVPELKAALTGLATEKGIQIDPNNELGLVDLALGRISTSAPTAAAGAEQVKQQLAEMGIEADGTVAELDKMLESLLALSTGTLNTRAAQRQFHEAIDAVTDSISKNGKSLSKHTAEGRANQAVLDAVASSGLGVATSMAQAKDSQGNFVNSQADVQASLQSTYDETMKAAQAFTGNEKAAEALTRKLLGIPKDVSVKTWMDTFARDQAQEITQSIAEIPGYTEVTVAVTEDGTAGEVQAKFDAITGKTEYVFVTDDGTSRVVQEAIANIDGKDVKVWVDDKGTVIATQGEINGIKGTNATVRVTADGVSGVESQLNWVARPRSASVTVTTNKIENVTRNFFPGQGVTNPDNGAKTGLFGRASGGSVFGPGSETSDSIPAWLSNNEHVLSAKEVRGLGGHGAVERLRALARNGDAPAFASGGRVTWARSQRDDLKAERDAAKRELDRAKKSKDEKRKTRAQKAYDAAKSEYEDARDRVSRLAESEFDLRRDLKRGEIRDSFMSGNGMSVVDRLFDQSNNTDLSKRQRSNLRSTAYGMESQLLALEKRSESLTKKLEKAVDKRDELLSAQRGVQSSMVGAFDLGGLAGQTNKWGYRERVGKRGLLSFGKDLASGAKKLSGKVAKLQKLGFNENMIQQVIDEWTQGGTFELADAMLSMNKSERGQFRRSFKSLERYGLDTGESLTNAMSKGGIDAAEGLVKGLKSKNKTVEDAFYKLGKDAEKAFRRSLDMHSPSRTLAVSGRDALDGILVGHDDRRQAVIDAYAGLGHDVSAAYQPNLALAVPPSYEVAQYASAQSAPAGIDSARLESMIASAVERAVGGWQVEVGGSPRTKAEWYQQGKRHAERTR